MQNKILGRVYVLGEDIDTDQIIPAAHLVYSLEDPDERKKYGEYALSGVPAALAGLPNGNMPFIEKGKSHSEFSIIIAAKNFGCGSSREHAPAALEIAGVKAVITPSYARIFYRNAVDGGFLIPAESEKSLVDYFKTGDQAELDFINKNVTNTRTGESFSVKELGQVSQIIEAGGIFEYARISGMLQENTHA
ncbi:MAG: 3-isopropylmalate dehydratase [Calditrichaeota bacterium]|nr:MAG: 3-isopropylmalate dehydratase [Calditrichota bacterium]